MTVIRTISQQYSTLKYLLPFSIPITPVPSDEEEGSFQDGSEKLVILFSSALLPLFHHRYPNSGPLYQPPFPLPLPPPPSDEEEDPLPSQITLTGEINSRKREVLPPVRTREETKPRSFCGPPNSASRRRSFCGEDPGIFDAEDPVLRIQSLAAHSTSQCNALLGSDLELSQGGRL
jgi:hypothetical protein